MTLFDEPLDWGPNLLKCLACGHWKFPGSMFAIDACSACAPMLMGGHVD